MSSALMTNYEVLTTLMEELSAMPAKGNQSTNEVRQSFERVVNYLKPTHGLMTSEAIQNFFKDLDTLNLGLSIEEEFQLVNVRPSSEVQVYLIISDCETRLTDDQVTDILVLLNHHFPVAKSMDTVEGEPSVTVMNEA